MALSDARARLLALTAAADAAAVATVLARLDLLQARSTGQMELDEAVELVREQAAGAGRLARAASLLLVDYERLTGAVVPPNPGPMA